MSGWCYELPGWAVLADRSWFCLCCLTGVVVTCLRGSSLLACIIFAWLHDFTFPVRIGMILVIAILLVLLVAIKW